MYFHTCLRCATSSPLRPEDLKTLTRVELMLCLSNNLDSANMVKVTCPRCATEALVSRESLGPGPSGHLARSAPATTPALFREAIDETASLLKSAFDKPGPLFSETRKEIITRWLENLGKNLRDAQEAFRSGRDVNGTPMTRTELANAVRGMCNAYRGGLARLGEVCGPHIRQQVEKVLDAVVAELPRLES